MTQADEAFPDQGAHSATEYVVLLHPPGRPSGSAPKSTVHGRDTPLHLAFSCWLTDADGRVLVTSRAAVKRTWPGVWTNAFCGHPSPGEDVTTAVHRRGRQELGTDLQELQVVLPDFRYSATMHDGTMENEICPVYLASTDPADLSPDPQEVADYGWTTIDLLIDDVARRPHRYSPWLRTQLPHLLAQRVFLNALVQST